MAKNSGKSISAGRKELPKSPTGIRGLDEITFGGLPRGRPTLVCGAAGCGKTLLAMEFLVRGALEYGEPGVFMSFEENAGELTQNFASLGFDLDALIAAGKISLEYVYVERSEIEVTGDYDLEGLFIRLQSAIDSVGAKRVVLDTIEALFSGLSNENILRAELRRLFRWLKDKGMTTVITGESGGRTLTRFGLEEYVADCVIVLDHRVSAEIATRRLKIVKYRGSHHGTNEYPFLIDAAGVSVFPITSLELDYPVSDERVSSGVAGVDEMLDGKGYYRGSAVLISGSAGTGKTTFCAHFADAVCTAGRRCLFFAFEESAGQILRDTARVGLDLASWMKRDLLRFSANRPTVSGLEMHLVSAHKVIDEYKPDAVVIDPISNLVSSGTLGEAKAMLARLLDFLRARQTTVLFSDLTGANPVEEETRLGISSLTDTWIVLDNRAVDRERRRSLFVLKSRGMRHSGRVREFVIGDRGVALAGAPDGDGRRAPEEVNA